MVEPAYPNRIGLERALEIVAARAAQHRLPVETVPLAEAQGRVLAEGVRAPHPLPPFDNSAMDGFALRSADLPVTDAVAVAFALAFTSTFTAARPLRR